MGNLDGMGFSRPVGNNEAEALRPDRGLNIDRIVDPGTSRKRNNTPENNGIFPSNNSLFHHPV